MGGSFALKQCPAPPRKFDIDADFSAIRRGEVIDYVQNRYGKDYVTGIGTYSNFKLKASVKAIAREFGVDPKLSNYISGMLDANGDYTSLFKAANEIPQLKEFIQLRGKMVELLPLMLNQPSNTSVHAAGIIIVPKIDKRDGIAKDLSSWLPIKQVKGQTITEWEGKTIDQLGYIKYDFLGLLQLDKFERITSLIQQHHGISITYDDIPLDVEGVYDLFRKGFNEDVFQFAGGGLSGYTKELLPNTIDDLIATVALYRPGPMDIGAHKDFIERKNGRQEVIYDYKSEEITKNTYGLWVYQEQIMFACMSMSNFTLVEADGVRKAMGKKQPEELAKYGDQFISGAIKNGFEPDIAMNIWEKFKMFGGYAFNLSHSACYGITGYFSQWFKYSYPLEFWTTALEFSDSDQLPQKIVEIQETGIVRVAPVDINKSEFKFIADKETNTIYWSLSSIKWVGDASVEHIMVERDEYGMFFSFEEFYERVEKKYVNKRGMIHLILSGAFDEIEHIEDVRDRWNLIEKFMQLRREKMTPDVSAYQDFKDYQYFVKQKELTGLGNVNYTSVIKQSIFKNKIHKYLPAQELEFEGNIDKEKLVAGIIKTVTERNSKKGKFCQIELDNNSYLYYLTIWNEYYEPNKEKLKVGKLLLFTGKVVADNYKKKNVLHSNESTIIEII